MPPPTKPILVNRHQLEVDRSYNWRRSRASRWTIVLQCRLCPLRTAAQTRPRDPAIPEQLAHLEPCQGLEALNELTRETERLGLYPK